MNIADIQDSFLAVCIRSQLRRGSRCMLQRDDYVMGFWVPQIRPSQGISGHARLRKPSRASERRSKEIHETSCGRPSTGTERHYSYILPTKKFGGIGLKSLLFGMNCQLVQCDCLLCNIVVSGLLCVSLHALRELASFLQPAQRNVMKAK